MSDKRKGQEAIEQGDPVAQARVDLELGLCQVARRRKGIELEAKMLETLETKLAESDLGQQIEACRAGIKEAKADLVMWEDAAREAALVLANVTGEQRPAKGVEVKQVSELCLCETTISAVQWAIDHNLAVLLKLNVALFKKVVKAGIVPSSIAWESKEAKIYLARDLSDYLPNVAYPDEEKPDDK